MSSTFSDLKLERDALQESVFPRLERRCQSQGFQFQAIDLRWGVPAEAALDHRTMRICFEELRRSQQTSPEPNFLILLGDRYGWRPIPELILEHDFEQLQQHASNADEQNVLRSWYRRDFNSIAPVYELRARTDSPDGQDYTHVKDADGRLTVDANGNTQDTSAWRSVQQILRELISRAFPSTGLQERFELPSSRVDEGTTRANGLPPDGIDLENLPSLIRFQTSATEQEIHAGALSIPHASRHVLAFFREISGCEEVPVASVRDYFDITESGELDADARQQQELLKETLRERLGDNAVDLPPARLVASPRSGGMASLSTEHVESLCREVEERLGRLIDQQIEEWRKPTSTKYATNRELEIEEEEHLRLAQDHAENFIGRDGHGEGLERIHRYLDSDSRVPLVVHGSSGSGKTALLAKSFMSLDGDVRSLIRFLGTTPHTSDLRSLLSNLCAELRRDNALTELLPTEVHGLQLELRRHFEMIGTGNRRFVIFLDALDQLSDVDEGLQMHWLPGSISTPLPENLKIVVSCLSDRPEDDPAGEAFAALQRRGLVDKDDPLKELSVPDARSLLFDRWMRAAGRSLSGSKENQAEQRRLVERLLQQDARCRLPLYLRQLFEELRQWRSWDAPSEPGTTVASLLEQRVARLSEETNHGSLLVSRVLGYLAAARRGLSESEILEVLFTDHDYKQHLDDQSERNRHALPSGAQRIPAAIWARMRSSIDPYLTERQSPGGNVLTFYHRTVSEWVFNRFVSNADWSPHVKLAEYFKSRGDRPTVTQGIDADAENTSSRRMPDPRKCDELPWQLSQAGLWDDVESLLCSLEFVEEKCRAGMVHSLVTDFDRLADLAPEDSAVHKDRFLQWRQFVNLETENFERHVGEWPQIVFQQAANQPQEGYVSKATQEAVKSGKGPAESWIEWVNRPQRFVQTDCLRLFSRPVHHIVIDSQGQAVSAHGGQLEIWSLDSGKTVARLQQDNETINAMRLVDDDRLLTTTSSAVSIWDLTQQTRVVHGLTAGDELQRLYVAGDLLVSASSDGAENDDHLTEFRDVQTGTLLGRLRRDAAKSKHLGRLDTSRVLASDEDGTAHVWDLSTGQCQVSINAKTEDRISTWFEIVSPQIVASYHKVGSEDGLRLWSTETGECVLQTHAWKNIAKVLPTPDGRRLCVCGREWIDILSVPDGEVVASLQDLSLRHSRYGETLDGVQLVPDHKHLACIASDGALHVYDLLNGRLDRVLKRGVARPPICFLNESTLVVSSPLDELAVWDLENARLLSRLSGHAGEIKSVIPIDEGRFLSWSADTTVRVWKIPEKSLQAGESLVHRGTNPQTSPAGFGITRNGRRLDVWQLDQGVHQHKLAGHTAAIEESLLDDRRVVTKAKDDTIRVWDLESGECQHVLSGHDGSIRSLERIGEDRVYSTSADGTLRVWDLNTGVQLGSADGHSQAITRHVRLPGDRVATASANGTVGIWDLASGDCLRMIECGQNDLDEMIVLKDGRILTASGFDQLTIAIWDTASGDCVRQWNAANTLGHKIKTIGDRRFVLWGQDTVIRVYHLDLVNVEHEFTLPRGLVRSVFLNSDGHLVVTGWNRDRDSESFQRVWNLDTGRSIDEDSKEQVEHEDPDAGTDSEGRGRVRDTGWVVRQDGVELDSNESHAFYPLPQQPQVDAQCDEHALITTGVAGYGDDRPDGEVRILRHVSGGAKQLADDTPSDQEIHSFDDIRLESQVRADEQEAPAGCVLVIGVVSAAVPLLLTWYLTSLSSWWWLIGAPLCFLSFLIGLATIGLVRRDPSKQLVEKCRVAAQLRANSRYEESLVLLEEARALAESSGMPAGQVLPLLESGAVLDEIGEHEEALSRFERALDLLEGGDQSNAAWKELHQRALFGRFLSLRKMRSRDDRLLKAVEALYERALEHDDEEISDTWLGEIVKYHIANGDHVKATELLSEISDSDRIVRIMGQDPATFDQQLTAVLETTPGDESSRVFDEEIQRQINQYPPEKQLQALKQFALDFTKRGGLERALAMYEWAESLARDLDKPTDVAFCVANQGSIWEGRGNIPEAIRLTDQALTLARDAEADELTVQILTFFAETLIKYRQDPDRALALIEERERFAREEDDLPVITDVLDQKVRLLRSHSRFEEAVEVLRRRERILRELNDDEKLFRCLELQVDTLGGKLGDHAAALPLLGEMEEISERLNNELFLSGALFNHASMLFQLGRDSDTALEKANKALAIARRHDLEELVTAARHLVSELERRQKSEDLSASSDSPDPNAWLHASNVFDNVPRAPSDDASDVDGDLVRRAVAPVLGRDRDGVRHQFDTLKATVSMASIMPARATISLLMCPRCGRTTVNVGSVSTETANVSCSHCKRQSEIVPLVCSPDPLPAVRDLVARHLECLDKLDEAERISDEAPEDALRLSNEAAAICRELGTDNVLADALDLAGKIHWSQGELSRFDELFDEQERFLGERPDSLQYVHFLISNALEISAVRGNSAALELLDQVIAICRRNQDLEQYGRVHLFALGLTKSILSRTDDSDSAINQVSEQLKATMEDLRRRFGAGKFQDVDKFLATLDAPSPDEDTAGRESSATESDDAFEALPSDVRDLVIQLTTQTDFDVDAPEVRQLEAACESEDEKRALYDLLLSCGQYLVENNRNDRVQRVLNWQIRIARTLNDERRVASSLLDSSIVGAANDPARALSQLSQAEEIFRALDDRASIHRCVEHRIQLHARCQDWRPAVDVLERHAEFCREGNEIEQLVLVLLNQFSMQGRLGHIDRQNEISLELAEICRESGNKELQAYSLLQQGKILAAAGNVELAVLRMRESSEVASTLAGRCSEEQCHTLERAGFPLTAYEFLLQGLAAAAKQVQSENNGDSAGKNEASHVTAVYLSDKLCQHAAATFGVAAVPLLREWNITQTDDFGKLTETLVEAGLITATEDDSLEQFHDLFDVAERINEYLER